MLSAVSLVQDSLKSKRITEDFEAIFKEAEDKCDNLSLGPIVLPRTHRPPKIFSGQGPAYTPGSAVDFYRPEFCCVLDTVDAQITERFMQSDIQTLKELENSLLTPKTDDAAVRKYPELNGEDLRVNWPCLKTSTRSTQLQMLCML